MAYKIEWSEPIFERLKNLSKLSLFIGQFNKAVLRKNF